MLSAILVLGFFVSLQASMAQDSSTSTTMEPTTTAWPFNCDNLDDGNYEHPEHACSRHYFTCAGGVALQEECPYNTFFEKTRNECQFKMYTPACGGELQETTTTDQPPSTSTLLAAGVEPLPDIKFDCMEEIGNFPNPLSQCSQVFFICAPGYQYGIPFHCAPTTFYDLTLNKCLYRSMVTTCNGGQSPPRIPEFGSDQFNCTDRQGNYAPENVTCPPYFFMCAAHRQSMTKVYCPAGLIYSVDKDACLTASEVPGCPQYAVVVPGANETLNETGAANETVVVVAVPPNKIIFIATPNDELPAASNETVIVATNETISAANETVIMEAQNEAMSSTAIPLGDNDTIIAANATDAVVIIPADEPSTTVPIDGTSVVSGDTKLASEMTTFLGSDSTAVAGADSSTTPGGLESSTLADAPATSANPGESSTAAGDGSSTTLGELSSSSSPVEPTSTTTVDGGLVMDSTTTAALESTTASMALESTKASIALESTTASIALESTTDTIALESTTASIALESTTASIALESTTASNALESTTTSMALDSTTASTPLESTTVIVVDGSSSTTGLPPPNARMGACKDRINGFYPNPSDCESYFFCADTAEYQIQCQGGTVFNEKKNQCDAPARVFKPCGSRDPPPTPFLCTGRAVGRHPDLVDCNTYYSCDMNGEMTPHRCEGGLSFNAATMQCDLPQNIPGCAPKPNADLISFCVSKRKDDIYALGNPNNYVLCVQNTAFVGICPGAKPIFDIRVKSCVAA